MSNPVPIPANERLVFARDRKRYPQGLDPNEGKITPRWLEWFSEESRLINITSQRIFDAGRTDQSASISATDLSNGALATGLYRLSYYATIVRAATVSSTLTVTLDFTDNGQSKSLSGTAITANAVTAFQSASYLIRIDNNSPVRYSTTYGSVGGTSMQYDLSLTLERVL